MRMIPTTKGTWSHSVAEISSAAVAAPQIAIDPKLGQFQSVGVCAAFRLERGAPAAEDWDSFGFVGNDNNNRCLSYPFSRMGQFGQEFDLVASIVLNPHSMAAADRRASYESQEFGVFTRGLHGALDFA